MYIDVNDRGATLCETVTCVLTVEKYDPCVYEERQGLNVPVFIETEIACKHFLLKQIKSLFHLLCIIIVFCVQHAINWTLNGRTLLSGFMIFFW